MKSRCLNPKNASFKHYGGRGITICSRWLESFENFLADMGASPSGLQIERINNDGNYEPGNCRWATAKEQSRNRSNNRLIERDGLRKTAAEWSEILGLNLSTIESRIYYAGYSDSQLLDPTHQGVKP